MAEKRREQNPLKRAGATLSDLAETIKGKDPEAPEAARAKEFDLAIIRAVRIAKRRGGARNLYSWRTVWRALANAIYDDRERFGARWVSRLDGVFDELTETAAEIMRTKKGLAA